MMMENSAIAASQYNTDQTGIMRYSQINTTVIQKQKQKPISKMIFLDNKAILSALLKKLQRLKTILI